MAVGVSDALPWLERRLLLGEGRHGSVRSAVAVARRGCSRFAFLAYGPISLGCWALLGGGGDDLCRAREKIQLLAVRCFWAVAAP